MSYQTIPTKLAKELLDILEYRQLIPFYQPVVSFVDQRILGYECITRGPADGRLHYPFALFHAASKCGRLLELETICYDHAVKYFQQLQLTGKLFFNLSFSSLLQSTFQSQSLLGVLNRYHFPPDQLVIEVGEKFRPEQISTINDLLKSYRLLGCQIALDDLGTGYSVLRLWSELRPNYVKIDNYFTQNLRADLGKKEFVRSLRDLAMRLNCKMIAEGIETAIDFKELLALGVHLGQGDYFASPQANPPTQLPSSLFLDSQQRHYPNYSIQRSKTIACLIEEVPVIRPTEVVEKVADLFHANPEIHSIPVINNLHAAIGIVRRHSFIDLFLTRYGRELHGRKPISGFMDTDHLILDINLSLEEASQQLTANLKLMPNQDFIIGDYGRYCGIGRVMDLLAKITELQIRNARYANPLTLLPGNVPIYEHLDSLLRQRFPFTVCYCDLDHFKPFNDVYGYSKGDLVIQTVAKILVTHTSPQTDFVGHIGGDDFILVMQSSDWQARCATILAEFEKTVLAFYNSEDCAQGGIRGLDRTGQETFFPLLSLSIGAVTPDLDVCHSYHDIAAMASDAKHQAKTQVGNSLFIDQRKVPNYQNRSVLLEQK
jgi:EAL domain-containing protein (putative c-di-GMP-specific phosphodiesterase class I)/GGDEF domain-containing protein